MKNTILFKSLAITLAIGLVHAPALRADESDYSPLCYDEDEAKEQRSLLRPYLEPSHIPTSEYLASCKGESSVPYTGDETPEQLKAMSAKFQANHDKIVAALPEKLSVPVARKRKILVLTFRTGLSYHAPGSAGFLILLREAAKKYGAFELTERYKLDGIDAKVLSEFDAVVMNNNHATMRSGKYGYKGWHNAPKTPEYQAFVQKRHAADEKACNPFYDELLPAYVKNGGGVIGLHATLLREMKRPENVDGYGIMFGGMIDSNCHPWKDGKIAGPGTYGPIPIKILEPNNPITFPFRDVPTIPVTELFSFFLPKESMDSSRTLIRYDYDKKPDINYNQKSLEQCKDFAGSLIWIKSYGKGRVFYNAMGHDEEIYTVPCVAQADLDGLLYATGDLKVPDAPATAAGK